MTIDYDEEEPPEPVWQPPPPPDIPEDGVEWRFAWATFIVSLLGGKIICLDHITSDAEMRHQLIVVGSFWSGLALVILLLFFVFA